MDGAGGRLQDRPRGRILLRGAAGRSVRHVRHDGAQRAGGLWFEHRPLVGQTAAPVPLAGDVATGTDFNPVVDRDAAPIRAPLPAKAAVAPAAMMRAMTCPQRRAPSDPQRGRAVAADLRRLGAKKILIRAAEQGYVTELACKMATCFCPEELGEATYFEPVTAELSDWMPTHEHYPVPKQDGGKQAVDNAILAHRLCNRIDYSIRVNRSHARDLERIREAREEAIALRQQRGN